MFCLGFFGDFYNLIYFSYQKVFNKIFVYIQVGYCVFELDLYGDCILYIKYLVKLG